MSRFEFPATEVLQMCTGSDYRSVWTKDTYLYDPEVRE